MTIKNILLTLAALLSSAFISQAIQLEGLAVDRGVFSPTETYVKEKDIGSDIRVGRSSGTNQLSSAIFVFQLPDLEGDVIETATFNFYITLAGNWNSDYEVDLYGLRFSSSNTVLTTDGYVGTNDVSATQLQANINPEQNKGETQTDEAGDLALTQWLNGLYEVGAKPGDYAFLRLSLSAIPENDYHYDSFASANNATTTHRPMISITLPPPPPIIIPEAEAEAEVVPEITSEPDPAPEPTAVPEIEPVPDVSKPIPEQAPLSSIEPSEPSEPISKWPPIIMLAVYIVVAPWIYHSIKKYVANG